MSTLKLTLKRHWFGMIASGEKKEEYRQPSHWILSRLEGKKYDRVEFRNGYSATSPVCITEYRGWKRAVGKAKWGAGKHPLIIIQLGKVIR
jgi:hypothetical protein